MMKFKNSVVFLVCIIGTITSERLDKRSFDAEGSGSIPDLDYIHDTKFCTDVSEWGPVKWVEKTLLKCDTTFDKDRKARRKTVCDNVTELKCDIVPYTECELKMISKPIKAYKDTKVPYHVKGCNETTDIIKHIKMVPHCVNETKLNCVTLWKTDDDGNQVWAGNEDCEEVTWKKCELRPKEHEFIVPKLECGDTGDIIMWDDCEEYKDGQMAVELTCNVLHTTKCEPKVTQICRDIEYDEWFEQPKEDCHNVTIKIPEQIFEHKKKCLFHDNGNGGAPEPKHSHHEYHGDQGHHEHHSGHGTEHHSNHATSHIGVSLNNQEENRQSSNLDVRAHIGRRRSPSPDQATSSQKLLPIHPSLNGFELHKQRHGKSVVSNITVIYPFANNQIAESPDKNSAILERNTGKNPYWTENKASPAATFHIGKKITSNDKLAQLLNIEILKIPPKDNQKKVLRKEHFKGVVKEIKNEKTAEKTK